MAPRKKTPEQIEREYYEARLDALSDADPWKDVWEKLDEAEADREDGYRNELTGVGMWERDKTMGGRASGPCFELHLLTRREISDRWRGSLFGKKIIEKIPEEMIRGGFDVIVTPNPDGDAAEGSEDDDVADAFPTAAAPPAPPAFTPKKTILPEIDDEPARIAEATEGELKRLRWSEVFFEALCYRRAFGGGAIYLGIEGEEGMADTPLEEGAIKRISHLTAFSGGWDGELIADSYYADPLSPNFGKPEIYMLRVNAVPSGSLIDRLRARAGARGVGGGLPIGEGTGGGGARTSYAGMRYIHASRLLVLPQVVDRDTRVQCRGWADGVFSRIDRVLSQDDMSWGGIAILMSELSQTTIGVTGLASKTNAEKGRGKTGGLRARVREMQMTKGVARALVYDKTEEIIGNLTANVSGAGEILNQLKARVAAAADMPQTILYGDSPGGLGSNGEQETRYLANEVRGKQEREMLPPLEQLVKLIFLSSEGPTQGVEPERWRIEFRSLYQPTEKEVAETRKIVADTDSVRIKDGVLTPEEVAADAYGGSRFSMERHVDFDGRAQMQAEEEAAAKERQAQVAVPPAVGTAPDPEQGAVESLPVAGSNTKAE